MKPQSKWMLLFKPNFASITSCCTVYRNLAGAAAVPNNCMN